MNAYSAYWSPKPCDRAPPTARRARCGRSFHHQNVPRLRRALARVDTIVVRDPYWIALAEHADIVVPSATAFEREDYSGFAALAGRLWFGGRFTEGPTARQWLAHLYEKRSAEMDFAVPIFEQFWRDGSLRLPHRTRPDAAGRVPRRPRLAPARHPSSRIEILSEDIADFGYADCAGHPAWFEPTEWRGCERAATYRLHLVASPPATRLHGRLDGGACLTAGAVIDDRLPAAQRRTPGRRAFGSIRPTTTRCACTAIPTCRPTTSAPRHRVVAAPGHM